jgi:hypothetical protein
LIELRNNSPVLRDGTLEISYNVGRLELVRTLGKKKMTLSVNEALPDPTFEIC